MEDLGGSAGGAADLDSQSFLLLTQSLLLFIWCVGWALGSSGQLVKVAHPLSLGTGCRIESHVDYQEFLPWGHGQRQPPTFCHHSGKPRQVSVPWGLIHACPGVTVNAQEAKHPMASQKHSQAPIPSLQGEASWML